MPLSPDDRLAILDLAARYNQAIDGGDVDGWVATWTDACVFEAPDGTFEGHDGMRTFAKGFMERFPNTRHWNANHAIDGDGDSATMHCYLLLIGVKGGPKPLAAGRYDDVLKKVDGAWRFQRRKIALDK